MSIFAEYKNFINSKLIEKNLIFKTNPTVPHGVLQSVSTEPVPLLALSGCTLEKVPARIRWLPDLDATIQGSPMGREQKWCIPDPGAGSEIVISSIS